ncbi:MAG: CynX/NimT family MFS transporter [Oscillospiraceae bacterium]|jgi:OFA family oxalate/formate antiporter-like MFS transporter
MVKIFGKQVHYAWVILICCVLLAIGATGAINCYRQNFVNPVVSEFGCTVTEFTITGTVECVVMAVLYTTASRMLTKYRIGKVMSAAVLLELIGLGLMSVYPNVYWFYLSGALLGIGSSFTVYMAVPLVINMWFRKKAGTALGIYSAAMFAGSVLYSQLSGWLITSSGWRMAYLIIAIIGAVVTLPALFFLMKSPEEKGIAPYGTEDGDVPEGAVKESEAVWGYTKRKAMRMPLFYVIWIVCMLYSVGTCAPSFIAAFATMQLGTSVNTGALAVSIYNIGSIVCSFMLGILNDRFGVTAGMLWGAVFNSAGMLCLIFSTQGHSLLMIGCFLIGMGCMGMYSVQAPLIAKDTLGTKNFSSIWSVMMTGNSLIAGIASPLLSEFYDIGGSYKGIFVLSMSFFIAALIIGTFAVKRARKLRAAGEPEDIAVASD